MNLLNKHKSFNMCSWQVVTMQRRANKQCFGGIILIDMTYQILVLVYWYYSLFICIIVIYYI